MNAQFHSNLIQMARDHGGKFHGPRVEHLSISETAYIQLASQIYAAGMAAQREESAKVAEEFIGDYEGADVIASTIRERIYEGGAA